MPRGEDAAITLRPIRQQDQPFLLALFRSTREPELAALPWDDAQKSAFVRMQFDAQHAQYQEHYAGASFDIKVTSPSAVRNGRPLTPDLD